MGADSDYGELLAAYSALQRKAKWWGAAKTVCTLVAAFLGAGWTARGYLEQLATKDHVAVLIRGQQEQLRLIDERLAIHNNRITVVEVLCREPFKGLEVRR